MWLYILGAIAPSNQTQIMEDVRSLPLPAINPHQRYLTLSS
ncbi:MAG: hypothetical protein WBB28_06080 [Crinalium sp.]